LDHSVCLYIFEPLNLELPNTDSNILSWLLLYRYPIYWKAKIINYVLLEGTQWSPQIYCYSPLQMSKDQLEKLLWSVALPGFGQLLNKNYVKGIILIFLEFLINIHSHFNQIIMLSFHGKTHEAVQLTDYAWIMFYPCVYMFAIWDAVRGAKGQLAAYACLPYVSSAYMITIGVMFSNTFTIFGVLWGPVWLPILFCFLGIGLGQLIKFILSRNKTILE
jgi:hypothetical protein